MAVCEILLTCSGAEKFEDHLEIGFLDFNLTFFIKKKKRGALCRHVKLLFFQGTL